MSNRPTINRLDELDETITLARSAALDDRLRRLGYSVARRSRRTTPPRRPQPSTARQIIVRYFPNAGVHIAGR